MWPLPRGGTILGLSAVPMVLPSSGSIGNNGALTLTTALPEAYAAAYMYFPAGAIAAGSAAGIYYVAMSTTQAGTIYNNTYSSGRPAIPASPTSFVTTGPGAYTQSTSEITLASYTIPGGSMGINGSLRISSGWRIPNNANNKTVRTRFATQQAMLLAITTNVELRQIMSIHNQGVTNRQRSTNYAGIGTNTGDPFLTLTVDTSVDSALAFTAQLANASDYTALEILTIELFR